MATKRPKQPKQAGGGMTPLGPARDLVRGLRTQVADLTKKNGGLLAANVNLHDENIDLRSRIAGLGAQIRKVQQELTVAQNGLTTAHNTSLVLQSTNKGLEDAGRTLAAKVQELEREITCLRNPAPTTWEDDEGPLLE